MLRRIILVCLIALPLGADTWNGVRMNTCLSDDGRWQLVVVPNTVSRMKLSRKGRFGIWHRVSRLIDEGFATDALVANDGTFVTINTAASRNDVIAIYRRDGTVVRKLTLSDLMSDQDLAQLPQRTWGTRRIEGDKLVLVVFADKQEEVPISLTTGEVLVPRHPFFTRPRVTWSGLDMERCIDGYAPMSAGEIESHALAACLPDYPPVARKAHIGGTVIVELDIATNGHVGTITMLKPMPFGLDRAALEAAGTWRFKPMERDGKPVPACGRVMFSFILH